MKLHSRARLVNKSKVIRWLEKKNVYKTKVLLINRASMSRALRVNTKLTYLLILINQLKAKMLLFCE